MPFRPGEDLYYITYEVTGPVPGAAPIPMSFSYDADPAWTGERTATTADEIAAGRRTSTLRSEDEFAAAIRQGRGYEKGRVYRVNENTYIKIKSVSKFNPATLTQDQWAKISETERWSVDYLTGKYAKPGTAPKQQAPTFSRTDAEIFADNNVYSGNKRDTFLAALTNRSNDLPRTKEGWATDSRSKGTIKQRYPVVINGVAYPSAEHAFLSLRNGSGEVELMAGIIAEKLRQHPKLLAELQKRAQAAGGIEQYVSGLVHLTKAAGSWEGVGLGSPFLQALLEGAKQASDQPETTEPTDLIAWVQDPKNQQNFPRSGRVRRAPDLGGAALPVTQTGDIQRATETGQMTIGYEPRPEIGAGEGEIKPQEKTARLLNEFATMRETAAESSTMGSRINFKGLPDVAREQLHRALGATGPYGFRFDSLNREAVSGIDPTRTIGARIAALAAKMGVTLPEGLDFKPGSKFVADKKTMAEVMSDLLMAIRFFNQTETEYAKTSGMAAMGDNRAEAAALLLELSRTLHEVGDPSSRGMLMSLVRKAGKSPEFLGLASKGGEMAGLGVDMERLEGAAEYRGRKTAAKLRQFAAAQLGMVPQAATRSSAPTVYRALGVELTPVQRGGKASGATAIQFPDGIHDLQRVVDEVGIFDGMDDHASIDLLPRLSGTAVSPSGEGAGVKMEQITAASDALSATHDSPLQGMLGLEDALRPISSRTSLTSLDRSGSYAFSYRTGFRYQSRLGKGQKNVERAKGKILRKVDVAQAGDSEAVAISKLIAKRDAKINAIQDWILRANAYLDSRRASGVVYTAVPEGHSDAKIQKELKRAGEELQKLRAYDPKPGVKVGRMPTYELPDYESEFEAELAPRKGALGADAQMQGILDAADEASARLNSESMVPLTISGDAEVKVTLPAAYLAQMRDKYARWKSAFDDVASIHGADFAAAYMASEEGIALHGIEPAKFDSPYVMLKPGSYLLPSRAAKEIVRLNPEVSSVAEGITFRVNFEPVVSSKYIVLKNGSVVSARGEEAGFIKHRKVYPFQVVRTEDGYTVRRLDSYEYENTDPNQRYSQERLGKFLNDLETSISGGRAGEELDTFTLLNELSTAIAFDGYSSLEILASNGDMFPQLEAEILAAIGEQNGMIRTNLAPKWTQSRMPELVSQPEMTAAERAMRKVSPVPLEAETADSVKIVPMRGMTEPRGLLPGMPTTQVIDTGTTREATSSLVLYGQRQAGSMLGQTVSVDDAIAAASPAARAIQGALGDFRGEDGSRGVSVYDLIASPERFGHSVRQTTMDIDSAEMYFIRALRYLQMIAEESAIQAGYGQRGRGISRIVVADQGSVEGLSPQELDALARETTSTALVAARAAVAAAKGVLRVSWSDGLDPQSHRHTFDLRQPARTAYDEYTYPLWRLLEPALIEYFDPASVQEVRGMIRRGGPALQRAAGAVGDKATAFFNAFYRGSGLPDPKLVPGEEAVDLTLAELARKIEGDTSPDLAEIRADLLGEIARARAEVKSGTFKPNKPIDEATLLETIRQVAPDAVSNWESGFDGQPGMMRITRPDGTVEVVNEAEWRAASGERKRARQRQKAIDMFDAANGLDEEGMPIELDLSGDYTEENVQIDPSTRIPADKFKRAGLQGYKFARAVAVKYNSSGNITEAINSVLDEFDLDLIPNPEESNGKQVRTSREMKVFFRAFWKELSARMKGNVTGPSAVRKVKAILDATDGRTKVENSQRIWISAEESVDMPAELVVASDVKGKVAVVKLTEGGKLAQDKGKVIDLLKNLIPTVRDTDESLRYLAWRALTDRIGASKKIKIPFDSMPGPVGNMFNTLISELQSDNFPVIEVDPPSDVEFKPAAKKTGGVLDGEMLDQNDYEHLQDSYAPDAADDYSGGHSNPEDDIFNYSVKQGKLLGMLQPDMLFPKFSPGVKRIDLGLRTPKGNALGGGLADVGVMALQGNLTPENALFSAGLNSVGLLTKSPFKAGVIGSTAALAATAATGGDIGRALFGITGSIIGGALGGFASGGIGTLAGSMGGGFVADELWKGLFGSNEGMRPLVRPVTPDIPNVRIP